jgi:predicted small secreted protein
MKIPKMTPIAQFFALIALAAFLCASLTACGTIHGFGRDVENTGEYIQGGSR